MGQATGPPRTRKAGVRPASHPACHRLTVWRDTSSSRAKSAYLLPWRNSWADRSLRRSRPSKSRDTPELAVATAIRNDARVTSTPSFFHRGRERYPSYAILSRTRVCHLRSNSPAVLPVSTMLGNEAATPGETVKTILRQVVAYFSIARYRQIRHIGWIPRRCQSVGRGCGGELRGASPVARRTRLSEGILRWASPTSRSLSSRTSSSALGAPGSQCQGCSVRRTEHAPGGRSWATGR